MSWETETRVQGPPPHKGCTRGEHRQELTSRQGCPLITNTKSGLGTGLPPAFLPTQERPP